MYSSSAHFPKCETTQMCNLPFVSHKSHSLTAAVLCLPLVAEYCMTRRLYSPFSYFVSFIAIMASYFVVLDLSSLDINLTCLFSLSNLSFFLSPLVCISFIPLYPSPIPTSHLQPGHIRYLVSCAICPLGAF